MARSWFVVVVFVMAACGHSTPAPRERPEGSTELTPAGSANTTGSANATDSANQPRGADIAASSSGTPHGDKAHGDEPHYQPLDLEVYDSTLMGDKLRVRIALPSELRIDLVNRHWTGVFTDAGKPIPGTNFTVAGTYGHEVTVDYHGSTLPSRTVRLFHPESSQ